MLNEKERSKNNILKIFKEIGRERAYHTMTAMIAVPRRGSIRNLDTFGSKKALQPTQNEDSSEEKGSDVEEPKDSMATLFLGFKKHPKRER